MINTIPYDINMVFTLEQHVFAIKYRGGETAKKYMDILLLNMTEVLSKSLYLLSDILLALLHPQIEH